MHRPKIVAALAAMLSISNAQGPPEAQAPIHRSTVIIVDEIPAVAPITVYSTQHITIWGCPAWETNCPVQHGQTQAVVTATVGATTTVCPLTYSQARLSSFNIDEPNTVGGPLSTSTTTWPTVFSLPSSFPPLSSYPDIDWASIFPSGAPAFSKGASTGSFAPGEYTPPPPDYTQSLSPEQASLLGVPANGSAAPITAYNPDAAPGASGAGALPTQNITMTTGSFAAIMPSNLTAYITTLNAFTANYSGGSAQTGNGSLPVYPTLTTVSNGSVQTVAPIALQTINVSPALPVNMFSLLVAISAVALAL